MGNATHLLLLYALTDLMACLTPGPAVLTVASHALAGSVRGAAGAIVGINVGNLIWYTLAGLGLVALVAAAPTLFVVLRWAGIGYLVWIGIESWRNAHSIRLEEGERTGFARGLASAVAVQLSNPKALIFFTVLLPPFIDTRAPVAPQLILLATIGVSIEVMTLIAYALLAHHLGRLALNGPSAHWIGRGSGILLLGAAANLALMGRR